MKAEELERDIAIHYDDGIAMNDHEGVIENIVGSAEAYANQRVIEELKKIKTILSKKSFSEHCVEEVDNRIKELRKSLNIK